MNYEALLDVASENGLTVKEKPLKGHDGRIKGDKVAIRQTIDTSVQKTCVLAEELGHYHTTVGDILKQETLDDVKQERRARIWAYDKLVGLSGIISAFEHRCRNRHETALHLEVTEEFLEEALKYYADKYGVYTIFDGYIIYFTPCLAVMKKF